MYLDLCLIFSGRLQTPPGCLETLHQLTVEHRLHLYLIYNGSSASYDKELGKLAASCDSLTLPLALNRRRLLENFLARAPQGKLRLALSGDLIWPPPALAAWSAALEDKTWLTPAWPQSGSLREQQAQAQQAPAENQFVACSTSEPPACLVWRPAADAILAQQLATGELSGWCDTGSQAWAAEAVPSAAEQKQVINPAALSIEQLQTQLRLSPQSPALYEAWLTRSPEPARVLEQAFAAGVISPGLLQQALQRDKANAPLWATLAAGLYGRPTTEAETCSAAQLQAFLRAHPQLPHPASLAVCLIVRDEEQALARCLASVEELAAELIVVDTGSQDRTVEIARARGARVIEWAWRDDFAAARNVSLEAATADWILILDADEYLDTEARLALRRFLWEPPPGLPRCQLQIHNQGAKTLVHFLPRLFPRHAGLRYRGRIHESLAYTGPGVSTMPLVPDIRIQHTGYRQEIYAAKNKAQRNLKLLQQQLAEEPDQPQWLFYYADSLRAAGKISPARDGYERALQGWETAAAKPPLYNLALIRLLELELEAEDFSSALNLAERYVDAESDTPDLWFLRGQSWRGLGDLRQAEQAFRRCLDFGTRPPLAYYTPDYVETIPLQELAKIYQLRILHGQPATGLETLAARLLELFPDGQLPLGFNLLTLLTQFSFRTGQDRLSPYRERLWAQAGQTVLSWLGPVGWLPERYDLPLSQQQLETFRTSRDFREQLATELWPQPGGQALAESILAVSQLIEPSLATWLLQIRLNQHDPQAELHTLETAQAVYPHQPMLANNRAMLLFQSGKAHRAEAILTACLRTHPDFAPAAENLEQLQAWKRENVDATGI